MFDRVLNMPLYFIKSNSLSTLKLISVRTISYHNPLSASVALIPHIETSQLSYTANQLTGFYMRATLALNGLSKDFWVISHVPFKSYRFFARFPWSCKFNKSILYLNSNLYRKKRHLWIF